MNPWTAVWIDQREARIFYPSGKSCEVVTVDSGIERHTKSTGGKKASRGHLHDSIAGIKSEAARSINETKKYFSNVAEILQPSERLLIVGSGNLKEELKSYIEETLGWAKNSQLEVKTTAYMTPAELKRWVLANFGIVARRWQPRNPGKPIAFKKKKQPAIAVRG